MPLQGPTWERSSRTRVSADAASAPRGAAATPAAAMPGTAAPARASHALPSCRPMLTSCLRRHRPREQSRRCSHAWRRCRRLQPKAAASSSLIWRRLTGLSTSSTVYCLREMDVPRLHLGRLGRRAPRRRRLRRRRLQARRGHRYRPARRRRRCRRTRGRCTVSLRRRRRPTRRRLLRRRRPLLRRARAWRLPPTSVGNASAFPFLLRAPCSRPLTHCVLLRAQLHVQRVRARVLLRRAVRDERRLLRRLCSRLRQPGLGPLMSYTTHLRSHAPLRSVNPLLNGTASHQNRLLFRPWLRRLQTGWWSRRCRRLTCRAPGTGWARVRS